MLEKLDLSKKVSKEDYNKQMDVLGERLGKAQRMARDAKRPIIIVFEGWRGARRSALINEMMQQMDARGFNVYSSVRLRAVFQCLLEAFAGVGTYCCLSPQLVLSEKRQRAGG